MTTEIREPVLLTGAGFTHNFGGFLAGQMWTRIFNHERVQTRPTLLTLLKDNFDFEFAYNQVMHEEHYTQGDRSALHEAVEGAYKKLDDATRNYWGSKAPQDARPLVSLHGFNDLLDNFASDKKARGYVFTLNQDIFVERWHSDERKHLRTLGMPIVSGPPDGKPLSWLRSGELTPNFYFQAPSDLKEGGESTSDLLYYVKLHGSVNWRSSDGRGLMVIGGDKLAQIQQEPILNTFANYEKLQES